MKERLFLIKQIFAEFSVIWMHKWSQCVNEDNFDIFLDQWDQGLRGISPEAIREAINYCRNNLEWPPSIAEFRRYCHKSQGLPSIDEVMMQGIGRNFYNPIVRIVFDKIGSWAWSHDSEKDLRKKIESALRELTQETNFTGALLEKKH